MIIRVISDEHLPEDKILCSVSNPDTPVKAAILGLLTKLRFGKEVSKYYVWHTVNERKRDTSRPPMQLDKSWNENGVAPNSFVYVKRIDETPDAVPALSQGAPPAPKEEEEPQAAAPPPPPPAKKSSVPPPPPPRRDSVKKSAPPPPPPKKSAPPAPQQDAPPPSPPAPPALEILPPPPSGEAAPSPLPSAIKRQVDSPDREFGTHVGSFSAPSTEDMRTPKVHITEPAKQAESTSAASAPSNLDMLSPQQSMRMSSTASNLAATPSLSFDALLTQIPSFAGFAPGMHGDGSSPLLPRNASFMSQLSDGATRKVLEDQIEAKISKVVGDLEKEHATEIAAVQATWRAKVDAVTGELTDRITKLEAQLAAAQAGGGLLYTPASGSSTTNTAPGESSPAEKAMKEQGDMLDKWLERKKDTLTATITLYEENHQEVELLKERQRMEVERLEHRRFMERQKKVIESRLHEVDSATQRRLDSLEARLSSRSGDIVADDHHSYDRIRSPPRSLSMRGKDGERLPSYGRLRQSSPESSKSKQRAIDRDWLNYGASTMPSSYGYYSGDRRY